MYRPTGGSVRTACTRLYGMVFKTLLQSTIKIILLSKYGQVCGIQVSWHTLGHTLDTPQYLISWTRFGFCVLNSMSSILWASIEHIDKKSQTMIFYYLPVIYLQICQHLLVWPPWRISSLIKNILSLVRRFSAPLLMYDVRAIVWPIGLQTLLEIWVLIIIGKRLYLLI